MKPSILLSLLLLSCGPSFQERMDQQVAEAAERARRQAHVDSVAAAVQDPHAPQVGTYVTEEEKLNAVPLGEHSATTGCDATSVAQFAEEVVERRLKAPRDAEFADYNDENVKGVGGAFTYVAYVDAPNDFGTMKRMYFKVWMHCEGRYLVFDDVKFEGQ